MERMESSGREEEMERMLPIVPVLEAHESYLECMNKVCNYLSLSTSLAERLKPILRTDRVFSLFLPGCYDLRKRKSLISSYSFLADSLHVTPSQ